MSKRDLAVIGGLATIVAGATAANRKKRWQEIHTLAVVVGGFVTIVGAFNTAF